MRRVICIGNRYLPGDWAGPRVFDALTARGPVAGVEVLDGGTGGLGLLAAAEGCERVVFVDTLKGYGRPGDVVVLKAKDVPEPGREAVGHGAGLEALIHLLPMVCEGPAPEMLVVGIESPAGEGAIDRAAEQVLALTREVPRGASGGSEGAP